MSNVKRIIKDIIEREGDFVNHPNDSGGDTKCGITTKTLNAWCLKKGIPVYHVSQLTIETASEIYLENYYLVTGISSLPAYMQELVLDTAVLHGRTSAIRYLQRLCEVATDGDVGPVTIKAAQDFPPERFVVEYVKLRINGYISIVKRSPSQLVFLRGSVNRAYDFLLKEDGQ